MYIEATQTLLTLELQLARNLYRPTPLACTMGALGDGLCCLKLHIRIARSCRPFLVHARISTCTSYRGSDTKSRRTLGAAVSKKGKNIFYTPLICTFFNLGTLVEWPASRSKLSHAGPWVGTNFSGGGSKYFRKIRSGGGTNLRGVQIKRDTDTKIRNLRIKTVHVIPYNNHYSFYSYCLYCKV